MSEPILKLVGTEAEPAAIPSGRWLTLQIAAQRADCNVGALRRRIVEEAWESRGLARKEKQASGQMGFMVRESADAAFALVKFAEQLADEFRSSREFLSLAKPVRDRALERESLLDQWKAKIDAGRTLQIPEKIITDRFVNDLRVRNIKASRSQLYAWRAAFKTTGLKGLVDEWGKRDSTDTVSFWQMASELWLHPNKRSKKLCYEMTGEQAAQHGWEVMSYRDFCRKLDAIPQVTVIKRREGESAFVLKAEPSIARDYASIGSNDWWCSDDHTLDVMVRIGTEEDGTPIVTRPVLHGWQDIHSRKILAWTLTAKAPRASDVLRTFVEAVDVHGAPWNVLVDNGKTFDSRAMQGVTKGQRRRGKNPNKLTDAELIRMGGAFTNLRVKVTHAEKYHGQSKPIERVFNTLCSRFAKRFEAYTGNSPTNKPGQGNGTNATQKAIERGDVLTIDEMRAELATWIADDYNARPHSGDNMHGRTPDQAYIEGMHSAPRRLVRELLEFATFAPVGPVKVHKNGVTWEGLTFGWAMDELIKRIGEQVLLKIDERNSAHIYVLSMDGSFICKAPCREKLPWGANSNTIRAGKSLKRRARRIAGEYSKQRPRLTMDVAELANVAAREEARRQKLFSAVSKPTDDSPPPGVAIVQTPFDGQLDKVRAALKAPLPTAAAAGAEDLGGGRFRYTRSSDDTTGEAGRSGLRYSNHEEIDP